MAIRLVDRSASLVVDIPPIVHTPTTDANNMNFTSGQIHFRGECQIDGNSGEDPAGWTLGMIQVILVDTDWAYYKGKASGDGSSFLQAARPPALSTQLCRDTITPGAILIDNRPGIDRTVAPAGAALPLTLNSAFGDAPSRPWPLTRVNGRTGRLNFLHEAQSEIHFSTVLTLQNPAGIFQHLKSVFWNLHWQASFTPSDFANIAAPWKITLTGGKLSNSANVSRTLDGGPTDRKIASVLTATLAPNCNTAIRAAWGSPNVRESNIWTNFDVTK